MGREVRKIDQLKHSIFKIFLTGMLCILFCAFSIPVSAEVDYKQIDAVIDVKTKYSDGCSTIQELANVAKHRKIDAVVYADHDLQSLEYGFWPLERIIKRREEWSSILATSPSTYLAEINAGDKSFKDLVLIPAVESSPFYYWTGDYGDDSLVANDWDKHLLIIGLPNARDYEKLPVLNGKLSSRYTRDLLMGFLLYLVLFGGCFVLVYYRIFRKLTIPLLVFMFLMLVNNHPFQSSLFDQYHGDRGIQPYQEMIDYAASQGAMVFWNHLESITENGPKGQVQVQTEPHPEDLILSTNYTGFQAVHDQPVIASEPGNEWDRLLTEYIRGKKRQAIWGYGGNDFHCEGKDKHVLGGVRTVLLVKEKNRTEVQNAMRAGRMYATRQPDENRRLSLDTFELADKVTGKSATLGEDLQTLNHPLLKIGLTSRNPEDRNVKVSLVRNGTLVKEFRGTLPFKMEWKDREVARQGKAYYRIKAEVSPDNYLLSNPIFTSFSKEPAQVASLPPRKSPAKINSGAAPVNTPKPGPQAISPPPINKPQPIPGLGSHGKANKPPVGAVSQTPIVKELPFLKSRTQPLKNSGFTGNVVPGSGSGFVRPKLDGVALKREPGSHFPPAVLVNRNDRLSLLGQTDVLFYGKPWLKVMKGNETFYVWEPLVERSDS